MFKNRKTVVSNVLRMWKVMIMVFNQGKNTFRLQSGIFLTIK